MSVCKHCSGLAGFHREHCPAQAARIERTGNIIVHRPTRPTTDKEVTK